jgi:hypothetical protein
MAYTVYIPLLKGIVVAVAPETFPGCHRYEVVELWVLVALRVIAGCTAGKLVQ